MLEYPSIDIARSSPRANTTDTIEAIIAAFTAWPEFLRILMCNHDHPATDYIR
jgi:hypothetical protein